MYIRKKRIEQENNAVSGLPDGERIQPGWSNYRNRWGDHRRIVDPKKGKIHGQFAWKAAAIQPNWSARRWRVGVVTQNRSFLGRVSKWPAPTSQDPGAVKARIHVDPRSLQPASILGRRFTRPQFCIDENDRGAEGGGEDRIRRT